MTSLVAISLGRRDAITDDDRIVPIVNMFDRFGAPVADPTRCFTFVACGGPNQWFYGRVDDYEAPTLH